MMDRVADIHNFPKDLAVKKGLVKALIAIGKECMDYAAAKDETML
jgi:hypothetical protein